MEPGLLRPSCRLTAFVPFAWTPRQRGSALVWLDPKNHEPPVQRCLIGSQGPLHTGRCRVVLRAVRYEQVGQTHRGPFTESVVVLSLPHLKPRKVFVAAAFPLLIQ